LLLGEDRASGEPEVRSSLEGGPRARRRSSGVGCPCPRLGSGEARSSPSNGLIPDLIAPIRPLQLCADGGYQLRIRSLEGTPNYGPRHSFLRRATTTMAAISPPAGGGIDDVFPTWRKSYIRVCPVTFSVDGGGGGAGMAKQEAAPRRLSSESTAPTPQRGTRRALTSRLRRRRETFPRNTPTPSRRTTPACSRRTCWALASYLRQRCSLSLTRLRHHPSIKRYRPFPVPCLLDSTANRQATSLRWTLS
jgi:hypothetical protein